MKDYQILLYEVAPTKRKKKIQYGDIDMDGLVSVRDARMVLQYSHIYCASREYVWR